MLLLLLLLLMGLLLLLEVVAKGSGRVRARNVRRGDRAIVAWGRC